MNLSNRFILKFSHLIGIILLDELDKEKIVMQCELMYTVKTESQEMIDIIKELWNDEVIDESSNGFESPITAILRGAEHSFECFGTTVFDAMEETIKTIYKANQIEKKLSFIVTGSQITDWDAVVFMIECIDNVVTIKSSQADSSENEDRYYRFKEADSNDIEKILKRNKNRTFKQAIKDEIALGGYLDLTYEEWYNDIINNI